MCRARPACRPAADCRYRAVHDRGPQEIGSAPAMNALPGLMLANHLASKLATTVTTFAPGDPKLATSDPSNPTGLVMVILVNLIIITGGVLLYLRHRRPPEADQPPGPMAQGSTTAGPPPDSSRAPGRGLLAIGPVGAELLHGRHGNPKLIDPLPLVAIDEPDAPGQGLAAAPRHTRVDEGVEHGPFTHAQPGHDRRAVRGEQFLHRTAPRPQDTLRPQRTSASVAILTRWTRVSSRKPEMRARWATSSSSPLNSSAAAGTSSSPTIRISSRSADTSGGAENQESGIRPANQLRTSPTDQTLVAVMVT